ASVFAYPSCRTSLDHWMNSSLECCLQSFVYDTDASLISLFGSGYRSRLSTRGNVCLFWVGSLRMCYIWLIGVVTFAASLVFNNSVSLIAAFVDPFLRVMYNTFS